jgi:acetylornithine aminotransferase
MSFRKETHPDTCSPSTQAMIEDHSQYLLNTYARPPLLFTRGKGCKLYATSPTNPRFNSDSATTSSSSSTSTSTKEEKKKEDEGKEVEYLDFTAGIAVNALGHADTQIASLLAEQAGMLSHSSNVCWNEWAGELGRLLVHQTREHGGLGFKAGNDGNKEEGAKVFFTNSGTESNEGALKFARLIGKNRQPSDSSGKGKEKTALVCFNNAFHGRSMGALSVTPNPKYQAPFSPLIPNVRVGQLGDQASLEELVTEDVCGVIVEPIQGEGGLNEANREWFEALGRRCREVGAVLIYDEIQVSRDFRCFACLRTSEGSLRRVGSLEMIGRN